MSIHLTINGTQYEVDVPPQTSLLSVLRDDLNLTASRYGCGIGVCGACHVLADDEAVPSIRDDFVVVRDARGFAQHDRCGAVFLV